MPPLTPTRWLLRSAITLLAALCIVAAIDYALDPYGLLRDPSGRKLPILFADNRVKFLMNQRYVPTNFDGLLLGPSTSVNWDLSSMPGVRIYNESLGGGDAAEQLVYMNEALPRGHYKLAILVLQRTMTSTHDLKDGLDRVSDTEAFASIHLVCRELTMLLQAVGVPVRLPVTWNGTRAIFEHRDLNLSPVTPDNFKLDPVAVADYQQIARQMQQRGIPIVYIATPVYKPCLLPYTDNGQTPAYLEKMRALMPPAPVIDLNQPQYDAFNSDPKNFNDCIHLDAEGAHKMDALLAKLIPVTVQY